MALGVRLGGCLFCRDEMVCRRPWPNPWGNGAGFGARPCCRAVRSRRRGFRRGCRRRCGLTWCENRRRCRFGCLLVSRHYQTKTPLRCFPILLWLRVRYVGDRSFGRCCPPWRRRALGSGRRVLVVVRLGRPRLLRRGFLRCCGVAVGCRRG